MLNSLQTYRKDARRWACCLLGLLFWAQLSFAHHQFEHAVFEADESCVVCLQLERNDDAIVDSDDAAQLPVIGLVTPRESRATVNATGFSHYAARASP